MVENKQWLLYLKLFQIFKKESIINSSSFCNTVILCYSNENKAYCCCWSKLFSVINILAWFCSYFRGWFWPILYFLCETSTWHLDSCPPEDTWYGVILWVVGVLGQGFNQSVPIFFIRIFSGCYFILTSPKKGETAVYGYNPALFLVLSVSYWCLVGWIFT